MSKHTPGPWYASGTVIYGASSMNIAELEPNDYIRRAEQEANARLIAAAPTLLDACKLAHARLTAMFLASGHLALAPTLQALGDAIETATKEGNE